MHKNAATSCPCHVDKGVCLLKTIAKIRFGQIQQLDSTVNDIIGKLVVNAAANVENMSDSTSLQYFQAMSHVLAP